MQTEKGLQGLKMSRLEVKWLVLRQENNTVRAT